MTILGVDLGTSRSTIGFFNKRAIQIVCDNTQKREIPSVAFLSGKDQWIFGSIAQKYGLHNPERLIYDTKRMLGHKFNDKEIIEARKIWQFKTREEEGTGNIIISIDIDGVTVEYYPYQISGLILKNLVDMANQRYLVKTNKLVVTIPATFTNLQRNELLKAADSVGLQIVRFINEPIAATIAYEYMNQDDLDEDELNKKRNILVFDLGAGTLDISFIEVENSNFKILAYDGDPFLGGRDWDNYLFKYVITELKKNYPNKEFTSQILAKIRQKCEETKIALSASKSILLNIEGKDEKDDMQLRITRELFYSVTEKLFQRCLIPIQKVLNASNLNFNDIDYLIMVGGSTNMPKIHEILLKYTSEDIEPYQGVDPEEAVAYGACIVGAKTDINMMMSNETQSLSHNQFVDSKDLPFHNMNLLGVCNVSFGIKKTNYSSDVLIPNKFQIPCQVSKEYKLNEILKENEDILLYENLGTKDEELIGSVPIPKKIQPTSSVNVKIIAEMTLDGILTITLLIGQEKSIEVFEPYGDDDTKSVYISIKRKGNKQKNTESMKRETKNQPHINSSPTDNNQPQQNNQILKKKSGDNLYINKAQPSPYSNTQQQVNHGPNQQLQPSPYPNTQQVNQRPIQQLQPSPYPNTQQVNQHPNQQLQPSSYSNTQQQVNQYPNQQLQPSPYQNTQQSSSLYLSPQSSNNQYHNSSQQKNIYPKSSSKTGHQIASQSSNTQLETYTNSQDGKKKIYKKTTHKSKDVNVDVY